MPETVTLKGNALTLKGNLVKEGQSAPDCELIGADLQPVKLSSFKGKALLLTTFPSLDTPVCSSEAHRFNLDMDKFSPWLTVVGVSMDLPFAQSRWCAAEGVKNLQFLSDYKTHAFGEKYGVLIEEIGLLARAVFLIDPEMKVVHVQLVKEVAQEPDYSSILQNIQALKAHT